MHKRQSYGMEPFKWQPKHAIGQNYKSQLLGSQLRPLVASEGGSNIVLQGKFRTKHLFWGCTTGWYEERSLELHPWPLWKVDSSRQGLYRLILQADMKKGHFSSTVDHFEKWIGVVKSQHTCRVSSNEATGRFLQLISKQAPWQGPHY